jgi:hypothetical protein
LSELALLLARPEPWLPSAAPALLPPPLLDSLDFRSPGAPPSCLPLPLTPRCIVPEEAPPLSSCLALWAPTVCPKHSSAAAEAAIHSELRIVTLLNFRSASAGLSARAQSFSPLGERSGPSAGSGLAEIAGGDRHG